MNFDVMKSAFDDELEKIAGAMVRSGRRPMKVETLLRKEKEEPKKVADIVKESALKDKLPGAHAAGLVGVGMLTMHQANKMKRRYDLGRQVEMQNQGY